MTFRNTNFTKRNPDCINIVAAVADKAPAEHFVACDASVLYGLTRLHTQAGVTYYGYL